jgi:hypothetical protein
MKLRGRVHNGVVVLEGKPSLPEGTAVTVSCGRTAGSKPRRKEKRVRLPLVRSKHPGTLDLTNERIAEILEEEELASFRKSLKRPKS